MTDHKPLPVQGYTTQSQESIDLVNEGKALEELALRYVDRAMSGNAASLAKAYMQVGFAVIASAIDGRAPSREAEIA